MIAIETLRERATRFAKKFEHVTSEKGSDQDFMRGFCKIFDISSQLIEWQYPVKNAKSTQWIDGLLPGTMLIEMKSAGKNLDDAYSQAIDYVHLLKEKDVPSYVLISDFQNLHLYDRETGKPRIEIKLAELAQKIEPFLFLAGYKKIVIERQEAINKEAAGKMVVLHDTVKATGYEGKNLETYLVRLLFCLFADDTGLFGENGSFLHYLENSTKADGSDLHGALNKLFDTLNTADEAYLLKHPDYKGKKRLKNLPEHLNNFTYINGALFEGILAECYFDEPSRNTLIECAKFDWSEISPAIFGSLFQAIMHFDDEAASAKTKKRREFGAHYTSEENILKTIEPLFMNDLKLEFEKVRKSKPKLAAFHKKLAELNFFDPACGCGNFLIIAYRELRLLELEVIKAQFGNKQVAQLNVDTLILCNVHQFHGIDIDESAVQIATLALWLVDHQMNLKVQELGLYYNRIPLLKKANIVCGNALQLDWENVIKPKDCSFIMGNPPFIGSTYQSTMQKSDLTFLFHGVKGAGILDYVTGWYIKAARFIAQNKKISAAFVSTNSICQGEQVGVLWSYLLSQGVKIRFAHRTFKWSNEGHGVAAVHCVIIGFSLTEPIQRVIFDNEKVIPANNINPYLVDAANILIEKRVKPLSANAPEMVYGNKPVDGGNLLLSREEKIELLAKEPDAEKWLRPLLGSEEFINNKERWCLWLVNISPNELSKLPEVLKRVEAVKNRRLVSIDPQARQLANRPSQFRDIKEPATYILIPSTSSEERNFIPIGFFDGKTISTNANFMLPDATLYHFGILTSTMHNAWTRAVCGRLESRYRYSNTIVYNNFPWATPTEKQQKNIEEKAQAVLDARAIHKTSTLADLYNPLTMPPNLTKAHAELDKAVDAAYGYKGTKDDAARVAFLFELYQKLTAPMEEPEPIKKIRKATQKRTPTD